MIFFGLLFGYGYFIESAGTVGIIAYPAGNFARYHLREKREREHRYFFAVTEIEIRHVCRLILFFKRFVVGYNENGRFKFQHLVYALFLVGFNEFRTLCGNGTLRTINKHRRFIVYHRHRSVIKITARIAFHLDITGFLQL